MLGAEALLRTAVASGVDVCFANPGTTELPIVAALDAVPEMRAVLGLFEGVLAGAADGYARMTGRPAMTLTHQGPSFANAIANLHNARRARSPVLNVIGDQPAWHAAFDPPLATDIEALARAVSGWTRRASGASSIGADVAAAIAAARAGQVASLVVPADAQWDDGAAVSAPVAPTPKRVVADASIAQAVEALRAGRSALLLGGAALSAAALRDAHRVASATGARVFVETFPARVERGAGLPTWTRVPYMADLAKSEFADVASVILVGAGDPVAFFGYPGGASRLLPASTRALALGTHDDDLPGALAALAEAACAPAFAAPVVAKPARPAGPLAARTLAAALAFCLPEDAVVIDEGVSAAGAFLPVSIGGPRHSYLALTGGACGQGLPCAVGAAIGAPGRKIVALVGDGSALYTVQSLWTQAREQLDVVNVVCANDAYRILQIELTRHLGAPPGPRALALTQLAPPALDWSSLARGFGVPHRRVDTTAALVDALQACFATRGPHLVEVRT